MNEDYSQLEEGLSYKFNDLKYLDLALTHKSYAHEHQCDPNERLEFFGDAILQCMISQLLFTQYPDLDEGSLSKFRAALVSEEGLTRIAHRLELGQYIKLGKGEESNGGRAKPSLLSDAVEAVIAACHLDSQRQSGWDVARKLIEHLFGPEIEGVESKFDAIDYKTALQEQVQHAQLGEINYQVVDERGPDHKKEFKITLYISGQAYGEAWGSSKKRAEQNAANLGLQKLQENL